MTQTRTAKVQASRRATVNGKRGWSAGRENCQLMRAASDARRAMSRQSTTPIGPESKMGRECGPYVRPNSTVFGLCQTAKAAQADGGVLWNTSNVCMSRVTHPRTSHAQDALYFPVTPRLYVYGICCLKRSWVVGVRSGQTYVRIRVAAHGTCHWHVTRHWHGSTCQCPV